MPETIGVALVNDDEIVFECRSASGHRPLISPVAVNVAIDFCERRVAAPRTTI
jgi:hypothetical protein